MKPYHVLMMAALFIIVAMAAKAAPTITSTTDVPTLTPGKALSQTITCSIPSGSTAVNNFLLSIPVPSGAKLESAVGSKGTVSHTLNATWTDGNSGAAGSSQLVVTWPVTLLVPNPANNTILVNMGRLEPGGDAAIVKIGWQF